MSSPPQDMLSPTIGSQSPLLLDPSVPMIPNPPSRYPITADTYHPHYPSSPPALYNGSHAMDASPNGNTLHNSPKGDDLQTYPESFNSYPMYNWSYKQQQVLQPPTTIPPLSYFHRPHRLEEIAPRDTITLIIDLFFDFVYPLTPSIHKPSFMADLHSRREERDPLFFALVMSTVASTLVQVPRSYVPMERPVVRRLAQVRPSDTQHDVTHLNHTIIDVSRS
jgi:hypothetical protein